MMKKKKSAPEIRINGYSAEWDQKKLGTIYENNNERNTGLIGFEKTISIATMLFKNEGNGASSNSLANYKVLREGDIAFEGHTNKEFRFGRFVANDIGTGIMSPRFTALRPIIDIPVSFWKYYIHYEPIMRKVLVNSTKAGTMMNELVVPEFLNQDVLVPSREEQIKIGEYFVGLDKLIAMHKCEVEKLSCVRQAMLEKMFPQNGADFPAVRFKGYTKPWRHCEFSEIFTERHIIDTVSEEYPQLSFTIEEGVIRPENRKTNKRDFLIIDKATKKYLQTEYDDIIYNPANVIYGAIHRNALGKGCVSPIYKIFYTDQDSTFMECIVRHPRFIKEISRSMEGTVKKLRTLKPKAFLEMSAYIAPTIEEQRQIGEYFRQMDRLIEIEKEELEKIKHIKSACLEKMFV